MGYKEEESVQQQKYSMVIIETLMLILVHLLDIEYKFCSFLWNQLLYKCTMFDGAAGFQETNIRVLDFTLLINVLQSFNHDITRHIIVTFTFLGISLYDIQKCCNIMDLSRSLFINFITKLKTAFTSPLKQFMRL